MSEKLVCLGRLESHSWGEWLAYDSMHERFWHYRRECSLMGCKAKEFAHDVAAVGKSVVAPEGQDPELPDKGSWTQEKVISEDLRAKMLMVLPHLRFSIEKASKKASGGAVEIGILVRNADGSGRVVSSFAAGEFIEDLATLLGAGPLTEEERQDAEAERLLAEFGLGGRG